MNMFLALCFLLLWSGQALADDARAPDLPATALVSPAGARLEVRGEADIVQENGEPTLSFMLPAGAENLQIGVPGQEIVRWAGIAMPLKETSALDERREKLIDRRIRLNADLLALKARLDLLQSPADKQTAAELELREKLLSAQVVPLSLSRQKLERELELVQQELAALPAAAALGQLVRVTLAKGAEGRLPFSYSYTLSGAGWQPFYTFDANPQAGDEDLIDVRLLAEVWQYSGMDWTGAVLNLATRGSGPREPAPLASWVVESRPKPQAKAAPMVLSAARGAKNMVEADAAAEVGHAPVAGNAGGVYARWQPEARGLPEGRSRLQITADRWKAPLQWLARPSVDDGRVWLLSKCALPHGQAWPEGRAEFSVAGQSVGSGLFRPEGGEASLFFGADPRVNVETIIDSRKKGETGLINTSNTWTWAWTYIISNEHDEAIKVRVERPAPMIVDQGVTVSYTNEPRAEIDEKKHMLFWVVEVPARGKTSISHAVTIKSPTKLPLLPDVP